jgi:hypothetical protein
MPCTNDGFHQMEASENRRKLDKVTAMLCGVMRRLETGYPEHCTRLTESIVGLDEWWTEHKRIDAERAKREAELARQQEMKKAALDKLTDEEKRALGIGRFGPFH